MKKGDHACYAGGALHGARWADAGGRAWAFTREETNLGDTWGDTRNGKMCMLGDAGGDAGELSSADRILTFLTSRPDAAFPLESTQVPESHPITYLQRGAGREV